MYKLPSPELTPYELMVKRNIEENRRVLESLGLLDNHVEKVRRTVSHKPRVRVSITPKRELPKNGEFSSVRTRRSSALLDTTGLEEFADDDEDSAPQKRSKVVRENVFGEIEGVKVGDWWMTRIECSAAGVHRPTVAGISGRMGEGCYSIALSGGYEDDIDCGEYFTYTGSGGRDLKGTKSNPKNLRTAPQSKDQVFDGMNAALASNVENKKPVRVIRGYKLPGRYAPEEGYRYDGLYSVEKCWEATGSAGFKVCKYALKRLASQDPPPWAIAPLQGDGERRTDEYVPLRSSSLEDSNFCPPSPTQDATTGLSPTNKKQRKHSYSTPTKQETNASSEPVSTDDQSQSFQQTEVFSQPNQQLKCRLSGLSLTSLQNGMNTSPCNEGLDDEISSIEHTLFRRLSPAANEITPQSLTDRIASVSPTFNAAKEVKRKSPRLSPKTSVDKENLLEIHSKDDQQDLLGPLQQNKLNKSTSFKISKEGLDSVKEHLPVIYTKVSPNGEKQLNDKNVDSHLLPLTNKKNKLPRDLVSVTALNMYESTVSLKIDSGATNKVTNFSEYSCKSYEVDEQGKVNNDFETDIPTKVCHTSSNSHTITSKVSTNDHISKLSLKRTSDQANLQSSPEGSETKSVHLVLEPSSNVQNTSSDDNGHHSSPTKGSCLKSCDDQSISVNDVELKSPVKKVTFSPQIQYKDIDGNSSIQPFECFDDDSLDSFAGFDGDSNLVFRGFEEGFKRLSKETPNCRLKPVSPDCSLSSPDKVQTTTLQSVEHLKSPTARWASSNPTLVFPKTLRGNRLFSTSPLSFKKISKNHSTIKKNRHRSTSLSKSIVSPPLKECLVFVEKIPTENEAKNSSKSYRSLRKMVNSSFHKRKSSPFNIDKQWPLNVQPQPRLSLMENLVQQNKEKRRLYHTVPRKRRTESKLWQDCKPCNVVLFRLEQSFPGFDENEDDIDFFGFNSVDLNIARKKSDNLKNNIKRISNPPKDGFLGWEPTKYFQGSSGLVPVGFMIEKLSESETCQQIL